MTAFLDSIGGCVLIAEAPVPVWIVLIVILIIAGLVYGNMDVRCPRCGFRTQRKNFQDGCCPSCHSKEDP
jgi:hypothetical protein